MNETKNNYRLKFIKWGLPKVVKAIEELSKRPDYKDLERDLLRKIHDLNGMELLKMVEEARDYNYECFGLLNAYKGELREKYGCRVSLKNLTKEELEELTKRTGIYEKAESHLRNLEKREEEFYEEIRGENNV